MQVSAFTILFALDYCDNYIYKNDLNGDVPVYNIHDITAIQSIYYFNFQHWESEEILIEYNWLVMQQTQYTLEQTPNNKQTICYQALHK